VCGAPFLRPLLLVLLARIPDLILELRRLLFIMPALNALCKCSELRQVHMAAVDVLVGGVLGFQKW
jgi:hypothetical protein